MKLILLLLISMPAYSQAVWKYFSFENPHFTVEFPSKPQNKYKIIDTDLGQIVVNTYYCASSIDSTDNQLYLINLYAIDESLFSGDSAISKLDYLNEMVNNIGSDLKSKEIYRNSVSEFENPIITYRFENEKNSVVTKGKIQIINNWVFSFQVFTRKQFSLNKNMDRFLNSFYAR